MFHTKGVTPEETEKLFTACEKSLRSRVEDAGQILDYIRDRHVGISFATPAGLSSRFQAAADAGQVSPLGNRIVLDLRKSPDDMADDLARRTRVLMQAPAPNGVERFLHKTVGISFGRFMKLEQKDGLRP